MNKLMITLMVSVALAISSAKASESKKVHGHLTWIGCEITRNAFMSELSAAYKAKTGVQIALQVGNASEGIRRVRSMKADMGGTSRHKLRGNEQELGVRLIPVAWDALVVVTHKENPVKNISLSQLRAVFDGKITNWSELGGSDSPIDLMVRKNKESGVGHALRRLLFKDINKDFASKNQFESSASLAAAVEKSPLSLAVIGISSAKQLDMNVLQLEERVASFNNIQDGSYLLYRPLYITMNTQAKNAKQVRKFIDFALGSEGRKVIRQAGTVPYFEALALIGKKSRQQLGQLL